MRKLFLTILVATFATTSLFSQQTIKSDAVSPFHTISAQGNLDVELIASDTNRVEIMLDGEVDIAKFKWGVENEKLSFTLRAGKGTGTVRIYCADTLKHVAISGGSVKTKELITTEAFRFSASGGAKATLMLDALDVELLVTGNSAIQISGETKYLDIRATEKSIVDTRDMYAMAVEAESTTGAEIYLSVEERLVANAKTSSTIFYKGKPTILKDGTSKMSSGMMGSSVLNIGE